MLKIPVRMSLENTFRVSERGSTVGREVTAGTTTFFTMCYIIFVQPAVLSIAGMDFGAVMVATCVASAIATFLMGIMANYPIALAPGMGENFYFTFTVCGSVIAGGLGYDWKVALGAIFISGMLFVICSSFGLRERLINVIPDSLKNAIAVGIGFLIAIIGFEWSGIVVDSPGTLIALGHFNSPPVLLSLFGLIVIISLIARRFKGALLFGMIVTALAGMVFGLIKYEGVVSIPPSIEPTFLKLDIVDLFTSTDFIAVLFVFFMLDLFDTIGTLVGISEQAGFMKDGKLPNARKALLSDAIGTVVGSLLGTSTVTSYIESAAGVNVGGRTGLSSVVTGVLFLLSLFFYPLVKTIGGGYHLSGGMVLYPVIAPVLIVVGCFMLKNIRWINWEEFTHAFPAFLTIVGMPFTFSITEGISFGFISYTFLQVLIGRGREVHWLLYISSAFFLIRYVLILS